jgi:galactose mutarotase-like enzyme
MSQVTPLVLQNDLCSVSIELLEGGRISSLRSVRSQLEFLTQANPSRKPVIPGLRTSFQEGPCAGIEECLPTVGACGPATAGGAAPDHGDFWQAPWDIVEVPSGESITLEATGFSRPLRFRKKLTLDGAALRVDYQVTNLHHAPLPFLYACHPLFAVDPGDLIVLPDQVKTLELYYSRGNRLGPPGTKVDWPKSASGVSLDVVRSRASATAEMFYTTRLRDVGNWEICRNATREKLQISFTVDKLPYVGIWLCYGGWPDTDAGPFQYAVALEPTTSPCNTLEEAVGSETAVWLAAGASTTWEICFRIAQNPS